MLKGQPIETAPRDGTVILTDEGLVRYVSQRYWASPVSEGWFQCAPCGYIFDCADNGREISRCNPNAWRAWEGLKIETTEA